MKVFTSYQTTTHGTTYIEICFRTVLSLTAAGRNDLRPPNVHHTTVHDAILKYSKFVFLRKRQAEDIEVAHVYLSALHELKLEEQSSIPKLNQTTSDISIDGVKEHEFRRKLLG